jgi:hypothetical protein
MSDEPTTITYDFAPGKTMSDERRAAALARIESEKMSDDDKAKLVIQPRFGWENERILLCDEADYCTRIAAEILATGKVLELERIGKKLLEWEEKFRFMGESKVHLDHNHAGYTAPIFEQFAEELQRERAALLAENKSAFDQLQDETTRGIPDRFSLKDAARSTPHSTEAFKKAVSELRKLDKTDPQPEKRIEAERYQPLTARDVQNVKAHLAAKHQRPKARSKARRKGTKSKGVTKGS